jgi:hypothetical protein
VANEKGRAQTLLVWRSMKFVLLLTDLNA